MKKKFLIIYVFISFIAFENTVYGKEINENRKCISEDNGFRNNSQGRGWFWGEEECEDIFNDELLNKDGAKLDNKKIQDRHGREYEKASKTQNIPWDIIDSISPKDIREKIEVEARDIAVNYPTYENIYEYNKLKKYIMDKAYNYALINSQVINSNNEFNGDNLNSTLAIKNYEKNEKLKNHNLIKKYKDNIALLFFKSESCPYCLKQSPIIFEFAKRYNIQIMPIEVMDYKELAYSFKATTIPDIFIIFSKDSADLKHVTYNILNEKISELYALLDSATKEDKDKIKIQRIATGLISDSELNFRISSFLSLINKIK